MWGGCPSQGEYVIRNIADMYKRELCCKKCGEEILVDKWDRWNIVLSSWRDNGLNPEAWEDIDDSCSLKPWIHAVAV